MKIRKFNTLLVASDESELSDLDSVISQDTRDSFSNSTKEHSYNNGLDHFKKSQTNLQFTEHFYKSNTLDNYSNSNYQVEEPRKSRRIGKDDKLAHQANLPFTVKVY